MKHPLLVIGADGLIGRSLSRHCQQRGGTVLETCRDQAGVADSVIRLDLAQDSWPALPRCTAAVICAAITSQEQCRRDPEAARQINVLRTLDLIRILAEAGTFVVFLSTNLVFDGSRPNQRWDEPLSPKIEYGRQKAEVERALAQWSDRVAIVRMTKVFHRGLPLLQEWLRALSASQPVNAFADYVCSPISLRQVVEGIAQLAVERQSGVWQFSGPQDVSYAQLASGVARILGANAGLVRAVPTPAGALEHHPAHTTLDASRAARELGLVFHEADQVLRDCLSES